MPPKAKCINKNLAQKLRREGKSVHEIALIIGLSESTVRDYVAGINQNKLNKAVKKACFPHELCLQWTEVVNVLRVKSGLEPLPAPVFNER